MIARPTSNLFLSCVLCLYCQWEHAACPSHTPFHSTVARIDSTITCAQTHSQPIHRAHTPRPLIQSPVHSLNHTHTPTHTHSLTAKVFLRKPKLLFLDEATSALDSGDRIWGLTHSVSCPRRRARIHRCKRMHERSHQHMSELKDHMQTHVHLYTNHDILTVPNR